VVDLDCPRGISDSEALYTATLGWCTKVGGKAHSLQLPPYSSKSTVEKSKACDGEDREKVPILEADNHRRYRDAL
jgi:hypothetical protein